MSEELANCLLCGSEKLEKDEYASMLLNLCEPHSVTKCCACNFRFLNPRPTREEYEEAYRYGAGSLVEEYAMSEEFYGEQASLRKLQNKKKLAMLVKAGAKGRLLELGSCMGEFLNEAVNMGFEVVGIEPGEENCRIARERYGLDLLHGVVEDFEFDKDSFDVVSSCHVFEHLLNPSEVATKVSKWLKPGGFHLIEVPNQFERFEFVWWRLKNVRKPNKRNFLCIHHPVFFSPKSLRRVVEMSGCRVYNFRNVYYPSDVSVFKRPKKLISRFMSLFCGALNIEVIGVKI